ncbi:MAG: indole-3-glycerol-phosphate synthase [Deltaproteobacteria bacterium]|nr:indole-3-glycerol-phosphate synthase [Deltaproteobacteria bacterium]
MATSSQERVEQARAREDLPALRTRALDRAPPPPLVRSQSGFDLIAEVKLRAPSAGVLSRPPDPEREVARRARAYADAGAAAISVLTEPSRFDGDLSHLAAAAAVSPVPVLRKDFLVDPYQVWEARAAGAGGVLLITRMLEDVVLDAALSAVAEAGMFALLEAFDGHDLDRTARAVAQWPTDAPTPLVGVNSRDLTSLEVDLGRLPSLVARIPEGTVPVAESGVTTPDDAASVARAGYALVLVGTALMLAPDSRVFARALLEAGRSARGGSQ